MDESFLLKSALFTAAIGVCALALVLKFSEVEPASALGARLSDEDSLVRLEGIVSGVSAKGNFTIITLETRDSIQVVAFGGVGVAKGQQVSVEGSVREYLGSKEVIADKITAR